MKTVVTGPEISSTPRAASRGRCASGGRRLWVLVAAYFALAAWSALALPQRVPMHWSGTGAPDQ